MKNVIRFGLATGLAAALAAFGVAGAQQTTGQGPAGSGTGSGSPDSVGKGDTGRTGSSASTGGSASDRADTGSSASGSTGSSATGSAGATAGATGSASAKKVDKKLQERLEKIHAANQSELHMAQLGAQNAESPQVKQFAEQMQTEHQQMDRQLTQAAQSMGVSLEGKDYKKHHDDAMKDAQKLQSKTGQDFDKEFMSRMVKDHEKTAKDVKDAAEDAKKAQHTELASTLQTAHTQIQGHLEHAKQVQKSVEQSGQQRQGRRPAAETGTGSSGATGSGMSGSSSDRPGSGSRGDTGGPTPGGADRGADRGANPGGGAAGTSSDPGTKDDTKK